MSLLYTYLAQQLKISAICVLISKNSLINCSLSKDYYDKSISSSFLWWRFYDIYLINHFFDKLKQLWTNRLFKLDSACSYVGAHPYELCLTVFIIYVVDVLQCTQQNIQFLKLSQFYYLKNCHRFYISNTSRLWKLYLRIFCNWFCEGSIKFTFIKKLVKSRYWYWNLIKI